MAKNPAPKIDEVGDLEAAPTPAKGMDLEGGLAFVTFAALLAGCIIAQYVLKNYFGAGMFGNS